MDLKPIVQKQLAIFECLRRFGFKPDELFVAFPPGGGLYTELRQDGRSFLISVLSGPAAKFLDADAYMVLWQEWAHLWNTELSDDRRTEIYRSVFTGPERVAKLEEAIRARGFRVERLVDAADVWAAPVVPS